MQLFAETTTHELTHPVLKDDEGNALPTGLVIEVLPADHDDVVMAATNVIKDLGKASESAEASLASRIKILETVVIGWTVKVEHAPEWDAIFKKLGFEDYTFSKEKLRALLGMKTARWVRNQIDNIFADAERFFQKGNQN